VKGENVKSETNVKKPLNSSFFSFVYSLWFPLNPSCSIGFSL